MKTALIVLAFTTTLCSAATQRTSAEINAERTAWRDYFSKRGYGDTNRPPDSLFEKFKSEYDAKLKAERAAAEKLKAARNATEQLRSAQVAAQLRQAQEAAAKAKTAQASKSLAVSIQGANRYDSYQCLAGVSSPSLGDLSLKGYSVNWTYRYFFGCESMARFGGASGPTMSIPRSVFSSARGPVEITLTVKDKDGRTGSASLSRTGPLN